MASRPSCPVYTHIGIYVYRFIGIALCSALPLRHLRITSGYGWRIHPLSGVVQFHSGIDFYARSDTVFSVLDGTVTHVGFDPCLGRFVRIRHGPFTSIYGHLSAIGVQEGQLMEAGQPIAITGATGRVTGEHLHLAIQFKNHFIHPFTLFQIIL